MKLIEINWNPTDRQLRQFGGVSLLALPALGWLWTRGNSAIVVAAVAIGAILALLSWIRPATIRPVFLALTMLTLPIGLVVGELAVLLMYVAFFLPIGLVFRLTGRDGLQLKVDRTARTYWHPKKQPAGPARYYRQS